MCIRDRLVAEQPIIVQPEIGYLGIICKEIDGAVSYTHLFNVTNFGQFNSPFYGLCQTTGDCAISVCCDFQEPVEMIPKFVAEWENGYKIVSGIKSHSKENKFIYMLRTIYYKMIRKMSDVYKRQVMI